MRGGVPSGGRRTEHSPMRITRILFVTSALKPVGGYQARLACLARMLRERGVAVGVLLKSPLVEPNLYLDILRNCGAVIWSPGQWGSRCAHILSRLATPLLFVLRPVAGALRGRRVAEKLRPGAVAKSIAWRINVALERNFDVVMRLFVKSWRPQIVHVFRPDEITAPAILGARACGVPVVYSETGEALPGMSWYPPHVRAAVARADLVVVTCKRVAENARRLYGPGPTIEVFPPVLPKVDPLPGKPPVLPVTLTFAGRLSTEKNLDALLSALAMINESVPPWRLLIAGDGPERDHLARLVGELGLGDRVQFVGRYDGPRGLKPLAEVTDLFVLPSKTEGFGIVLLEAAAMGRPSLVTPVGAAGELVRDGVTGFVAGDSTADALADALRRAMVARDLLPVMGRAARRTYEGHYEPDVIFEKMIQRYERLLEKPAGAAMPNEVRPTAAPPRCDVSFVVVNFNMRALMEEWLQHVTDAMARNGLAYEILVGDTSTDPAAALDDSVCHRWPNVCFQRVSGSSGWVAALNALLPETSGRYVCIIHPDSFIEPGCVRQCVEYLEAHPEAGVVAPNPIKSDGAPARARLDFPTLAGETRRLLNLFSYLVCRRKPFAEERYWNRAHDARTDTVLSFCFFCRRDLLPRVLPIPQSLRSWYANDYICLGARRMGYRVMYLKSPRVIHYERRTPRHLYSESPEMEYKGSTIAGSPGMHRDRLEFVRYLHPAPTAMLFRVITAAEFALRLVAAFVAGGPERPSKVNAYARVLGIALEL